MTQPPPQQSAQAAAAVATVVAGAMIAQQVAATATRDVLFLAEYPATHLPRVMAGSIALSFVLVLVMARLMAAIAPARVVPAVFTVSGALFAGEWALSLRMPRLAAVLVFLHTAAFGAAVISGFWSVLSERFDPHTAKRYMGRIGTGASFGGVIGGVLAWAGGQLMPVSGMLLLLAGINLACAAGLTRIGRGQPGAEPRAEVEGATESGFSIIRRVPYLQKLVALIGLSALAEVSLDYVFKARAADRFATGGELMTFFAVFYTAMGIGSFALQSTAARASLHRLGLTTTLAFRAIATTAGSVAALVLPGVWSVSAARGGEGLLKSSLFRSAYELLYTPLAKEKKRPTKTLIDVGCSRLGGLIGIGATAVAIAALPEYANTIVLVLAFVAALSAVLVVHGLHQGYVDTLADNLRSGVVRLEPGEVTDAVTERTLANSQGAMQRDKMLAELEARRRRSAEQPAVGDAELLAEVGDLLSGDAQRIRRVLTGEPDPRLTPHLIGLLGRDEVAESARAALTRLAPRVTGQLVDAMLDRQLPAAVRRRIPQVLADCATERSAAGLLAAVDDSDLDVRRRAGAALVRIARREPAICPSSEAVIDAALRAIEVGKQSWLDDSSVDSLLTGQRVGAMSSRGNRNLEHVFTVLSLSLDREPLRLAHAALGSSDPGIRGVGLEYLETVLPRPVHRVLWPYLRDRRPADHVARSTEQLVAELARTLQLAPEPD